MAKGQKRSNRETRKPKQPKAKAPPPGRSFLEPTPQRGSKAAADRKA